MTNYFPPPARQRRPARWELASSMSDGDLTHAPDDGHDLFGGSSPAESQGSENARGDALRRSGESDDNDDGSESERDDDAEKAALEYFEDDTQAAPLVVEEQTAWLNVPQLPLRRTKETMLARLPNFVRYADKPFDAETWDEHDEDDQSGDAEIIGDRHARSVLRTMSTLRWRWQDAGPSKYTPQSNARIVRWSDGSESLQIGSQFLDMSRHAEPTAQGMPLTYIYVPHPEEGVLEAECAVRTALSFKPNVHSETHSKMASAIRHQRGVRVVASSQTFGSVDPEREKERIERQLKESERKRHRERVKAMRAANDYDGDFDLGTRRHGVRGRGTRSEVANYWSDDDDDDDARPSRASAYDYADEDDNDGFIVDDDAEQIDASEDEMDRADRNIEAHERRRKEEHDHASAKRARTDNNVDTDSE